MLVHIQQHSRSLKGISMDDQKRSDMIRELAGKLGGYMPIYQFDQIIWNGEYVKPVMPSEASQETAVINTSGRIVLVIDLPGRGNEPEAKNNKEA